MDSKPNCTNYTLKPTLTRVPGLLTLRSFTPSLKLPVSAKLLI